MNEYIIHRLKHTFQMQNFNLFCISYIKMDSYLKILLRLLQFVLCLFLLLLYVINQIFIQKKCMWIIYTRYCHEIDLKVHSKWFSSWAIAWLAFMSLFKMIFLSLLDFIISRLSLAFSTVRVFFIHRIKLVSCKSRYSTWRFCHFIENNCHMTTVSKFSTNHLETKIQPLFICIIL